MMSCVKRQRNRKMKEVPLLQWVLMEQALKTDDSMEKWWAELSSTCRRWAGVMVRRPLRPRIEESSSSSSPSPPVERSTESSYNATTTMGTMTVGGQGSLDPSLLIEAILKKERDIGFFTAQLLMAKDQVVVNHLQRSIAHMVTMEWPKKFKVFVQDIVGTSKTNESLCQNNMAILKLLSEQVFHFSSGQMTRTKSKHLKDTMCSEFSQIFQLCQYVMENSSNPNLVGSTLETLLRFLNWIPLGYIFETELISTLTVKFLSVPIFRNITLKCLTEVAGMTVPQYDDRFLQLFSQTMSQLEQMVPLTVNIREAYAHGGDKEQQFIQNFVIFLCTYLKEHGSLIEKQLDVSNNDLQKFLQYLAVISEVDEVEIFKICLEYWNALAADLYREAPFIAAATPMFMERRVNPNSGPRRTFYAPLLSRVRSTMISRMAKPEEVLVVENENGEVVREFMKDTDSINLYKNMRETLVYLTHLDCQDTEKILTKKLQNQVNGTEWSWKNLNTLCWAIGSISGAMHEEDENRFIATVIKDLLGLCEQKKGKDNRAIIASNIMYVVGQYPRFLRAHWTFLKTVVNKLFEFMHDRNNGVQDMACDTFIKIAQKCRDHFVTVQMGEDVPLIEEILAKTSTIICDLQPQQVHTFYEAVGYMISAQSDIGVKGALFLKTIVNKLFEFMHDRNHGVQDMACDTFIKIAQKCRDHFVTVQMGEDVPLIEEILAKTSTIICDLQPQQVHTFHEAVGYMISAQSDLEGVQDTLIEKYMNLPNQVWDDIISQASINVAVLKDMDAIKQLASILKTNVRACKALAHPYVSQLRRIYLDMLNVYKVMSDNISQAITINGEEVTKQPLIKMMRVVKKETLKLIAGWVSRSNNPQMALENFIPPLLDAVLLDYKMTTVPAAREPEVLSTIAAIVNKLESHITLHIPKIFDAVFEVTLNMMNKDFEEFSEHRTNFFLLLQVINSHCFPALLSIPPPQFNLVLDSIIWAIKHTMRNVADTGLHILYQLLQNISANDVAAQSFYQTYFTDIVQHIFSVATDTSHTAGLGMHATILACLFTIVEIGKVTVPLNPTPPLPFQPAHNIIYVQEFVANLLKSSFPHLTDNQIKITVTGMFNLDRDVAAFKEHLRDFLVQIREFTGEDDTDLYLEEREAALRTAETEKRLIQMSVPGILNPHEINEEMTA